MAFMCVQTAHTIAANIYQQELATLSADSFIRYNIMYLSNIKSFQFSYQNPPETQNNETSQYII